MRLSCCLAVGVRLARVSFMYIDIYLYTVAVGVVCGVFSRSCGGVVRLWWLAVFVCMMYQVCFVWYNCIYVYNAFVLLWFVLLWSVRVACMGMYLYSVCL